jgi:hypothetical protein
MGRSSAGTQQRGFTGCEYITMIDAGMIVGSSENGTQYRAFYRESGGSLQDIPLFSGQTSTVTAYARAVNKSGVIVGVSGTKAFIWAKGMGAPVDVDTLKPTYGPTVTLEKAEDINNHGAIVGTGRAGSAYKAFLMWP